MAAPAFRATPSPRWPTWSMVRRSTMFQSNQKLTVAVAARDGRGEHTNYLETKPGRKTRDIIADRLMHGLVAHEAFLDGSARRLELRLDQRDDIGSRCCQCLRHGQHVLE